MVLANGMRKSIGDGKATRVWEDPWVMFDRPSLLLAPIHNSTNVEKVCDLMHESGDYWDEGRLRECFDEDICQRILCTMMDTWSQFDMGLDIDTEAISKFWKRLWKLQMLSSIYHALIDCPEIQIMWVMANYDYSSRMYHANVLEWMAVETKSWRDEQLCKVAMAMYFVWERRNAKKFSNEVIKAEKLWSKVERIMDEYQAANLIDLNNIVMLPNLEWEKPEYPYVKLNVDASTRREGGGCLGGLVRDATGCCLGAFMGHNRALEDVMLLEATALKKGLELALRIG
ncbi:uncharacterized protein G2W53_007257 [Senna tora]|uniref:RNase H type-1 domain-containing protein n=1 Tax=Senna tora TaxID=362788 RepID=A0A834X6E2_9FABA|nr:uncharacterized protein G2W53_007257 [Senna tora]